MLKTFFKVIFIICLLNLSSTFVKAYNASEIINIYNKISKPIVSESAIELKDYSILHKDFEFKINTGFMYLAKPIIIDSNKFNYVGVFVGNGSFRFSPTPSIEKFQVQRFYDSDSLNRKCEKALLIFDERIYQELLNNGKLVINRFTGAQDIANKYFKYLTHDVMEDYIIKILKNLISPGKEPLLIVNGSVKDAGQTIYLYNSYDDEEIQLLKRYGKVFQNKFLEPICSYSKEATADCSVLSGESKDQIKVSHYNIESVVNQKGKYSGKTTMSFVVISSGTQIFQINLHPYLKVDSIQDSLNNLINYTRMKMKGFGNPESHYLNVIINRPLVESEMIKLDFYTHGEITEKIGDVMIVSASSVWYPSFGEKQSATYDLKFKTPKDFILDAVGQETFEEIIGDTLFSEYKIINPTAHVSFNIGKFKVHDSTSALGINAKIHYLEDLHVELSRDANIPKGKNIENQMADDVLNCISLFSNYYGPYIGNNITVTEIIASHGQAYPNYLQLGLMTWSNKGEWNLERIFRAHEVAHQWWGVGVDHKTYHDQWLSEGFAEYSSLLYLQAIGGNEALYDVMKIYRNEIYSARKFLFGSGKESGPIALGYRTSSTATRGDQSLIIYKKGAYVLHMIRNLLLELDTMNEAIFLNMMRDYYKSYKGKKVTTNDFKLIVEKYAGMDMTWFFDQWVYGHDLPKYKFKYDIKKESDGYYYANCKITQSKVSEDFKMFVPIEIEFKNGSKYYMRFLIDKPENIISLPPMELKPKKITLNPFYSVLAEIDQ